MRADKRKKHSTYKSRLGWLSLLAGMLSALVLLWVGSLGWSERNMGVSREGEAWLCSGETAAAKNDIQIQEVIYQKDGIKASYPRIIAGGSVESMEVWNRIILEDFDKILKIYSFQPFPSPGPSSENTDMVLLNITYEVKSNTQGWLSILYRADFNTSFSAHPSNLVYTTNVDKKENRRLRLDDIINLDRAFVQDFRSWRLVGSVEDTKDIQEAINDYIKNISDEELLAGFHAADQIGAANSWGIYSYLTNDKLGISIELPHYAGDHAEFEKALADLRSNLKPVIKNEYK